MRDPGLVGLGRLTLRQAQSAPCMSCGTSPCCVYLPLHSFEVRTLRDLEHAIYLLNFDRIMLGLSPAGEWSVYYRHPCRFLDRSNPNNYLCTIHDMPLQPRICANYNPYACWYQRALGSGKSDVFLQIDRARMERIAEGIAFDEHRVIVETPDWPALLEIAATVPVEPLNDGALDPDPVFDLWLEKVASGSSFASGPVRRAYQDFLDPCDGCAAHCCKTLVFPLARPATRRSVDYIQFALGFPRIEVGISDGEWSLNVRTRCRHLTADNRCGVFGQPERPSLCRYYDASSCSYVIWNKLNPISVKVTTKEDTAAPHFTATIHKKDVTQNVTRPVADLKASAQTVDRNPFPGTGAAELAALQAKIPSPVAFAPGSAVVAAPAPLQFVGTYLHSVRRPKFLLTATGHAPVDPAAVTPAQKRTAAAAALTLSRQRVNAVRDLIRAAGIGVHQLNAVAKGDVGAAAAPAWDKVDIAAAIDPSYVNEYPRLAHEFGHMLGLGDEYPGGARVVGPGAAGEATHYGLSKDALGQDMADSFARITTDAEGIMQGGSDVRPVHYVTLWSALGDAAATATAPVPAFQRKDWKFVGF